MRFALFPKVPALIVAAALLSAPMADAGHAGNDGTEKAKEVATAELASEGVKEDMGVGERPRGERQVHKAKGKADKPRMSTTGVRQKWTECVGMGVEEAMELIRTARPDLKRVIKVREGSMVTMDMRRDRVRVYCNKEDVVTRPPTVG